VFSGIELGIADGIASIVMDDGKVNALSAERLHRLGEALDAAEKAGAVVVLRGRDGVFSAGFDLRTFERGLEATVEMLLAGSRLLTRMLRFPRPILTVCTGHAYPMGAFLMLAADVRLARAGPFRIGLNETAIGITVPRFAVELARHRLSPAGIARIPSAEMFDPEEARLLGYVDRIYEPAELEAAVSVEAERLRGLDPASFAATKARIHERALAAIEAAIEEELSGRAG